jgi:2-dehydro-3-deoxygalactonokinase
MGEETAFFGCDWGTSSFRLRRVLANGQVAGERRQAVGVKDLFGRADPADAKARAAVFAAFVRDELHALAASHPWHVHGPAVVVSGMASSSIGWRELPYARVPFALDGSSARTETLPLDMGSGQTTRVVLVSGLATADDVMRGEETELLGLFVEGHFADVAEDGLVVLPGTHSKHVVLEKGRVTGFRTYMTGELFDALSAHTVLKASLGDVETADAGVGHPENLAAFCEAVRLAAEHGLAGILFKIRSRSVLGSVPAASSRHALRGMLIGAELHDLAEQPPGRRILLAAGPSTADAYRLASEALDLGPRVTFVAADDMALAAVRGQRVLLAGFLPSS